MAELGATWRLGEVEGRLRAIPEAYVAESLARSEVMIDLDVAPCYTRQGLSAARAGRRRASLRFFWRPGAPSRRHIAGGVSRQSA